MRSRYVRDTEEVRSLVPGGGGRIVRDSGKPIAQVARDLGINAGTLGNWLPRTAPNAKARKVFRTATWPS